MIKTHKSRMRMRKHQCKEYTQKKVSNYIIGKLLERGILGEVKLAQHTISGQQFAMKIFEKDKIKCEDDFSRVVRQIQVLKLLNNSNIIKLVEVISTPRNIYLVTELADNGELFDYVKKNKRLMEEEACRFFRQIVTAVQYCHLRKVYHRDLKLENILLDSNMQIKITGFGLPTIFEKDYKLRRRSPSYVSPEMLHYSNYDYPAADVWSCGVILFAMICGYFPFDDDDLQKLFKKIASGIFEIPSFVSPQAADLISRIFVTDLSKRLTLPEIMQHPWYLSSCQDQLPIVQEINTPQVINSRIVYSMVYTLQGWDAAKIIRDLLQDRYNSATSTYFLLAERQQQKHPEKKWKMDELLYENALGLQFYEQEESDEKDASECENQDDHMFKWSGDE